MCLIETFFDKKNAGNLGWYDWGNPDADTDPGMGYIQDQLEQGGIFLAFIVLISENFILCRH
jgi:hypothetical protein